MRSGPRLPPDKPAKPLGYAAGRSHGRAKTKSRRETGGGCRVGSADARRLRARALDAGLAYELIASRSELEQIIAAARRGEAEPDIRTLTGWRRELVGEGLRDLLAGRKALSLGSDRRLELTTLPPPAAST